MHQTMEIVVERSINCKRNNLFITDKVAVCIANLVHIQDTQFTVLNNLHTDKAIVFNLGKINLYNSHHILLHYVLLFPIRTQGYNYKIMLEKAKDIQG